MNNVTERLFFGINFSDNIRNELKKIINEFRKFDEPVKWENPEKLHITLLFLGDVKIEDKLVLLNDTDNMEKFPTFDIMIKSKGVFPNYKMPRIIWLGIEENLIMHNISENIRLICRKRGIEFDEKEFKPHLTIGRIKGNISQRFKDFLVNYNYDPIIDRINSFELIKSVLDSKGSKYFTEKKFKLTENING